MIWFVTGGVLVGVGLAWLGWMVVPARADLGAELARLGDRPVPAAPGVRVVVGGWLVRGLAQLGKEHSVAADLAITGRESASWGASVVTTGVVLAGAAAGGWIVGLAVGVSFPLVVGVAAVLFFGAFGVVGAVMSMWTEAARRRSHFGRATTLWLRLTSLEMAAGMGVEEASLEAAKVGADWALRWVGEVVQQANWTGVELGEALRQLGGTLEIDLLVEVAGAVELHGREGSLLRRALQAMAGTARKAELAEDQARSNRISQRLFVPSMVLLVGYLLFIGVPAVAQLGGALSR